MIQDSKGSINDPNLTSCTDGLVLKQEGVQTASELGSALLAPPDCESGRAGLPVPQRDRGAISWQKENRIYALHKAALGLQIYLVVAILAPDRCPSKGGSPCSQWREAQMQHELELFRSYSSRLSCPKMSPSVQASVLQGTNMFGMREEPQGH